MPKVQPIKFVPTGPCRLSYVNVFEPAPAMNPGDDPVRQVSLLFPKSDTACIKDLVEKLQRITKNALDTQFFKSTAGLWVPMRDGDAEVEAENRGKEYAGMYFINAKSWRPVGVVNGQNQPILDPDELYSGCWANVQICFKAFSTKGKRGIRVEINLIQKIKDDERFDGADSADKVFETIAPPPEATLDTLPPMDGLPTSDVAVPTETETAQTQAADPSNPFSNLV